MEVAVIGLGQMGAAMTHRLLAEGHTLTVWNRDRAKAEAFLPGGASIASSPAEAAGAAKTVISMVANDAALQDVTEGKDGILSAAPEVLHISCSTVSTELTARLSAAHRLAGQRFVSAQVLGRPDVARAGHLSIMAAGEEEELAAAQPVLDVLGSKTFIMGDQPSMAAATKVTANFGIAAIIQMVSEQVRIAGASGVPPQAIIDLLIQTDFGSRMIGIYGQLIADGHFEPAAFPLKLGRKDVGLAIAAAPGVALPLADLLVQRMDNIIQAGGGDRDLASLGQ